MLAGDEYRYMHVPESVVRVESPSPLEIRNVYLCFVWTS